MPPHPKIIICVNPLVNRAVLDFNNEFRASPLNIQDYFQSVSVAGTRVNYDVSIVGDNILTNDDLIVDYNQYDNVTLDGIRVLLNGVDGQKVKIELRVGATATAAALVDADTQQVITLDGGGIPKLYEATFATSQILDPSSNIYWLFIQYDNTNTDVTSLVIDTTNSPVPFNPEIDVDGQFESTPAVPDGTYERAFVRAVYHTWVSLVGSAAYTKIIIPSRSLQSESSRILSTTLTFKEFIEE